MTSTHPTPSFDRILVVHGFGATTDDHWFPWLARSLPGVERLVLPDPEQPVAADWIPLVASAIGEPDPDLAVVAHSLGCVTVAAAVQSLVAAGGRVGAFVAVAPFAEVLPPSGSGELDGFVRYELPRFLDAYRAPRGRAAFEAVRVIRSDDDPLVPAAASNRFARDLSGDVVVVPGAGHFLADDGVTRLDPVLDALTTSAERAPADARRAP